MNQSIEILVCFINAVLMDCTLNLFFDSIAGHSCGKITRFIILSVLSIVHTVILCLYVNTILNLALFLLIAYAVSLLYNVKWYTRILLSFTVTALSITSELITNFIFITFFSISLETTVSGVFYILGLLLSKMILLFIIFLIRTNVKKALFANSSKRILPTLLIPLSSILMITLIYYCLIQIEVISSSLVFAVLICCTLNIVFNIIVFYFVEHIYNDAQKDIELGVAQGIIAKQSEQYNHLLESNLEIKAIRHDYNNITTGLISEIEKGNYDVALVELYKLKQSFKESALLSNNIGIVHMLVNQKTALAKESDITIDFEYHDLNKIVISDIDLAIILGNALDNAIEASALLPSGIERRIRLSVKVHNNIISVLIKNNVAQNVDVTNLRSTKASQSMHGFGVESMRQLVKKYRGELIFNCENRVFETCIVLTNL